MKRLITILLACVSLLGVLAFTSCSRAVKDELETFDTILLTQEEYAFAIAKENDALEVSVNELIEDMKKDGSLEALIDSYFDGTSTFSYENKSATAGRNDLVMATNAAFPPFEYKDGSAFVGVDVEIAYLLAKKLDKTLFVKDMDFDSIILDVKNGDSDIGMAGMTVNATRLEQIDFATPYYTSAQVLTVQKSDDTFDGCTTVEEVVTILQAQDKSYTVGTQTGTTGYMYTAGDEDFDYEGFPNLTTSPYQTGALAMTDLSNGRIDAVILDLQPSLMISSTINYSFQTNNLQIFYEKFFEQGGYKDFLIGLSNTVIIAVFGLLIGFAIGCVIATIKLIPSKRILVTAACKLCDVYVAIFRGTPMVVQLLLMHFALFPALGLNIPPVMEAVLIFGMNSAAYMAEILRSGINAVDKGQMEAGRSLGFGFTATMFRIILPQAIKNILPTLGNEFISLIKETSIVSFIAVVDVTKALKSIAESTYEYFVPYIVLALVYLAIILIITWLIKIMEKRLKRDER